VIAVIAPARFSRPAVFRDEGMERQSNQLDKAEVAELRSAGYGMMSASVTDGPQIRRLQKTKKPSKIDGLFLNSGGSGEIRTHERLTPSAVFKTAAFNHSATLPVAWHYT
jgi:hypothetical protein